MILEVGKKYKTKSGSIVTIQEFDPDYFFSFIGTMELNGTDAPVSYKGNGKYEMDGESIYDLISEIKE